MEIMFIGLIGAIMGLAARYFLPHRHTHGAVLVPAIGVVASLVLWVALTWAGLKWDAGLIWWISVVGTGIVVVVADVLIGRIRTNSDDRMLVSLSKGAAQPVR